MPIPSAPLLRSTLQTLLARALGMPLSLLQGVILTRYLGPAGLGLYSAILTDVTLLVTLFSVGLPWALANLLGASPTRLRPLLGVAARCGAILLLLPALLVLVATWLHPGWAAAVGRAPEHIALIAAAVLAQYARDVSSSLLLGTQQFQTQNRQGLLLAVMLLLAVTSLALCGWLTPGSAVALQIGSNLVLCALSGAALIRLSRAHGLWQPAPPGESEPPLLRQALAIGWRGLCVSLPSLLLLRIDVYFLQLFGGTTGHHQLGIYQAGVRIGELLLLLPGTVNAILFAKSSAREDLTEATLAAAKLCLYLGLICLAGMWLVGQPLLILLYGPRFAGSFVPCLLILLGCCCYCFASPLAGTLTGGGSFPRSMIIAEVIALSANVIANLLLIPRLGGVGAAAASALSYALAAAAYGQAFAARHGVSARELLRPESPRLLLRRLRQQGVQEVRSTSSSASS